MVPLFLFGTLQHRPLLEAVLGTSDHHDLTPAALPGYRVQSVAEGPFPMIEASGAGKAAGVCVSGLSAQDYERLDFYEAIFGYTREPVQLADGNAAECYFPPKGHWTPNGPWSVEDWGHTWGAISVISAAEVMNYYGHKTPAQVAEMFPMIRARAWSQINAASSKHGVRTLCGDIEIKQYLRPYANYFAVDEITLRHARFDGQMSPQVMRAVFRAPDATVILPYDPVRDRVLLVEQMRIGPQARGDKAVWQLEPVAGRLDPGEDPEVAARREAAEEAGITLGEIENAGEVYPSPGNSSEFLYFFVGQADLPDDAAGLGGLDAEDEDIRSHLISFDELMDMCDRHQVGNAPLLSIAYWLARHRDRLRNLWCSPSS